MRILILFAHPAYSSSRLNRSLVRAASRAPGVLIHDLYEVYPDLLIDVRHEQKLLLEYDLIIMQHPFYWYSSPAILKEWQDLVLEHGFAYGRDGTALKGKYLMQAITTGGGPEAYCKSGYNQFTIREFLRPFEQTANLCYMHYLPPFVLHGAFTLDDSDLEEASEGYLQLLLALHDGKLNPAELAQLEQANQWISQYSAGQQA